MEPRLASVGEIVRWWTTKEVSCKRIKVQSPIYAVYFHGSGSDQGASFTVIAS